MTLKKEAFEKIWERRKCWLLAFSSFRQGFLQYLKQNTLIEPNSNRHLQMLSTWTSLTFCHLVNCLPNEKNFALIKFKAFTDDKFIPTEIVISYFG